MYASNPKTKTIKTTGAGKDGGGYGGFRLPQTDVKSTPIKSCPHAIQTSSGSCPRCR